MVLKAISSFLNYWYFRYLLVTELYMVEKWERAMFHILIFILMATLYLFNSVVMLGLVETYINPKSSQNIPDIGNSIDIGNNYEL